MKYSLLALTLVCGLVSIVQGVETQTAQEKELIQKTKEVLAQQGSMQLLHQYFSSDCFNRCWSLIDKNDRTAEDDENMILLANVSLWHWKQRDDCEPLNLSVAYWLLGRVYCLTKNIGPAEVYGQKCIDISIKNKLPPFYLGYGYEVRAYASALEQDREEAGEYLKLAKAELAKVTADEDKNLLNADLEKIERMVKAIGEEKQ